MPTAARFTRDEPHGTYTEGEQGLRDRRDEGADFEDLRTDFETNTMTGQRNFRLYFRHYATADGLITVAGLSRGLRAKFHEATGITRPAPELTLASPEFQAIMAEAEDLFASETTAHWMSVLRAVGYPCGRYNLPFEGLNDPQVRANWFVNDLEHPIMGNYTVPGMPMQFSATPVDITEPSPRFAVHTAEVLAEIGLDADHITRLIKSETVIANP